MDAQDLRIMKAMGLRYFGPTPSDRNDFNPAAIAERVGLDQKTVRTRLERLRQAGFLLGFDLYPNIRLLGLQEGVCFFRGMTSDEKQAAFSVLDRMPGLFGAHDFHRGPLCVNFAYSDDPEERVHEIGTTLGCRGDLVAVGNSPAVEATVSALDWRIMAVLRQDALMSALDVAQHLGVAVKTVRRRLAHLGAVGAYYIFPRLDPTRAEGMLFANVAITPRARDRSEVLRRAREVVGPHTILELDPGVGNCLAVAAVASPAEAERLDLALLRTDGIEHAETYLLQGVMNYGGWLDEVLSERHGLEDLMSPA